MALKYDPNRTRKPAPEWASYIIGRYPRFKEHRLRNHAFAALGGRYAGREGIVYMWSEQRREWVEVYRKEKGPDRCPTCDAQATKTTYWYHVTPGDYTVPSYLGSWVCSNCSTGYYKVKPEVRQAVDRIAEEKARKLRIAVDSVRS